MKPFSLTGIASVLAASLPLAAVAGLAGRPRDEIIAAIADHFSRQR